MFVIIVHDELIKVDRPDADFPCYEITACSYGPYLEEGVDFDLELKEATDDS